MNHLIPISFVAVAGISAFSTLGNATSQTITGRTLAASTNTPVVLEIDAPRVGSRSNAAVASALRTFERLSRFPYSKLPNGPAMKEQLGVVRIAKVFKALDAKGGFDDVLRALGKDPSTELSEVERLGVENTIDFYFNGFLTATDRAQFTATVGTNASGRPLDLVAAVRFISDNSVRGYSNSGILKPLKLQFQKRVDTIKRIGKENSPELDGAIREQFADLVDDGSGLTSSGRILDDATIDELATLYRDSVPKGGRLGLPDIRNNTKDGPRPVLRALANGETPREAYKKTYVKGDGGFATVVLLRELLEILYEPEVDAIVRRTATAELDEAFQFVIYTEEIFRNNGTYAQKLAAAEKRFPQEFIARIQAYDDGLNLPEFYAPETFRYGLRGTREAADVAQAGTRLTRPEDVARVSAGLDEANQVLAMIRELLPETAGMALDEALAALRRTRRELGPVDERPELPDDLAKAASEIDDLLGDN